MAGKADIVDHLVNEVEGITKRVAGDATEAVFDFISQELAKEGKVQIPGFGTFSVSFRAARKGRNPQTGKPLDIPASKGAKFKAGKGLKDAVNN